MKLSFGFGGKAPPRDEAAADRMKQAVRIALGLSDDVALSVNEIACADPACPVLETIVLIMEPGKKTRAAKAHGSLAGMGADEMKAAFGRREE